MLKVLIKGAGDIATGVAIALYKIGFSVVMTEIKKPTVIRRKVSFANAIYENISIVEKIVARHTTKQQYKEVLKNKEIAVIIDEFSSIINVLKPILVVDAILAKKNLHTNIKDAPIVVALGPGFIASKDCDIVVETERGHNLGLLIKNGAAKKDTGIPGEIMGKSIERIIKSPCEGYVFFEKNIGDIVQKNEIIIKINNIKIKAPFKGCLRGALKNGLYVKKGIKIGDIDPRCIKDYCYSISDKSRTLGRAVVEAFLMQAKSKKIFDLNKEYKK